MLRAAAAQAKREEDLKAKMAKLSEKEREMRKTELEMEIAQEEVIKLKKRLKECAAHYTRPNCATSCTRALQV